VTTFRVGVTRDLRAADGRPVYGDIGLHLVEEAGLDWEWLSEDVDELRPEHLRGLDAVLVFRPRVTAASLAGLDRLALVARLGVGYDRIDVDALTRSGVLLTIAPDGVRRPMAAAALTLVLALAHKLIVKHRLGSAGRWHEAREELGTGLGGRTLGIVGLGNIGRDLVTLARPLAMRFLASDPYLDAASATRLGAELVPLEQLLSESDFVVVLCPLTDETRHLLDARRLALLKPTAYLVNVARGPIVDQAALTEALRRGRIAGAALDVFEHEPFEPDDPILALPNVIVTPHAVGHTDEMFRGNGESACSAAVAVAEGRVPEHVVNREVLGGAALEAKLRRLARA
jgi:phosphoglycerate dehydrogenase-like enzyme